MIAGHGFGRLLAFNSFKALSLRLARCSPILDECARYIEAIFAAEHLCLRAGL